MVDSIAFFYGQRHGLIWALLLGCVASVCTADHSTQVSREEEIDRQVRTLLIEVMQEPIQKPFRTSMLLSVARIQSHRGWFDEAMLTINNIRLLSETSKTDLSLMIVHGLADIAQAQMEAGQPDAARATYQEALMEARKSTDIQVQSLRLLAIIRSYVMAGLLDEAMAMMRDLQYSPSKIKGLLAIAWQRYDDGQEDTARVLITEALAMARDIHDPFDKSSALMAIARHQARMGWVEDALAIVPDLQHPYQKGSVCQDIASAHLEASRFDEALATARSIDHPSYKVSALCQIAQALAKSGQNEKAHQIYAEAEPFATQDPANQFQAIASSQAASGFFDDALQSLDQIPQAPHKNIATQSIAHALAKAGRFDEALAMADQTSDHHQKAMILSGIIAVQFEQNRPEAAHSLIDQALAAARSVRDPQKKVHSLLRIILSISYQ